MKISISCDHAGLKLKDALVVRLREHGYDIVDHGTYTGDSVDYPDYAKLTCLDVQAKRSEFGILICHTGIGMSIYANKFRGLRAALVTNLESASLTRRHNNSNILCLAGAYTTVEDALSYALVFLSEKFEGGRHERRVNKIMDEER